MEQSFHRVPGTVKDQITLFDKNISMEAVKWAAVLTGLDENIMQMEHGYDTECTPELFSQGQGQLLSTPGRQQRTRNFFFWMRSPRTWMWKPSRPS